MSQYSGEIWNSPTLQERFTNGSPADWIGFEVIICSNAESVRCTSFDFLLVQMRIFFYNRKIFS